MKIFDWVHRKFHTNVDYCMVSRKKLDAWDEEVKKTEAVEKDTEALLRDHVNLIKAFNGWPEGIFAIGTFGLDQLDLYQDEHSNDGDEYPIEEKEEEDQYYPSDQPHEVMKNNYAYAVSAGADKSSREDCTAGHAEKDCNKLLPLMKPETEIVETGLEYSTDEKKKKSERTTLADLFSAEATPLPPPPPAELLKPTPVSGKSPTCRKKHVGSLAKKLMPWKGEDSRPTTKIHRVFTKMLKRKIHPEFDSTTGAPGSLEVDSNVEFPIVDSSSSSSGYNSTIDVAQNESTSLL
ncbi:protein TILLER ANGLE CONTROL 1 [Aristolochia californica]|uniref:protein TILLER ANGLE CONTROL 1 n=1 Tax=Aristolochia californica TaxID=171875 RepID=UPI0035E13410